MVDTWVVALISEVFAETSGGDLDELLAEASAGGADLAVLPEIPLNPWSPATKVARDEDAEPPGGPRHQRLADAARKHRISLVGGAIVRDPETHRRYNTALLFDQTGAPAGSYCKVHLPEEPGFWETSHYEPGTAPPVPFRHLAMPFGIQICSDINRPSGSFILSAMGAELIICPRSTEAATFDRWRLVFRANAITACAYVLSVNRPHPEQGVQIGGPSIAVNPRGEILVETTDTLCIVELSRAVVREARTKYPGYLQEPAALYAAGWRAAAASPRGP